MSYYTDVKIRMQDKAFEMFKETDFYSYLEEHMQEVKRVNIYGKELNEVTYLSINHWYEIAQAKGLLKLFDKLDDLVDCNDSEEAYGGYAYAYAEIGEDGLYNQRDNTDYELEIGVNIGFDNEGEVEEVTFDSDNRDIVDLSNLPTNDLIYELANRGYKVIVNKR